MIHTQVAHNADISNNYLNEESEMNMTGINTQAIPVYYSSRTNAYSSLYAEEINSTKRYFLP